MSKQSTTSHVDASYYRNIVESLKYLVHTRPDIGFAVGYVDRFMENPTTEHLSDVKHIFWYIADTLHYGLSYKKGLDEIKFNGCSDADMAGNVDDFNSTTCVLFYFENIACHFEK